MSKTTVALFAFLAGVAFADFTNPKGSDLQDWVEGIEPSLALCTTDTDCMRFCPKEDKDCDGGPVPVVVPVKTIPAAPKLSCWPAGKGRYVRCEVL